ncbi:MAG: hypothetical protein KIS63_06750 [Caldilineales bacterium]|nr:hypothetical protein [Caldilineales bacterium]
MRRRLAFIAAAPLALALILLSGAGGRSRPVQAQAGSGADPFGVYFYPSSSLVGAQQMAELGVGWAHRHLDWAAIETSPGVYDWQAADAAFDDGARWGFRTIVTVSGNPKQAGLSLCPRTS